MPELKQIRASAGSGKTWTLTLNYLNLLAGAVPGGSSAACAIHSGPCQHGDIIAITFTNAAAAEMRDRVLLRLKKIALGEKDGEIRLSATEAQERLASLLRDLSSLNIRTIDSLLHLIVRVSALELGLNPEFEEEKTTSDAIAPYLEEYMELARHPGPMQTMLRDACAAMISPAEGRGFLAGKKLADHLAAALNNALLDEMPQLASVEEIKQNLENMELAVINAARCFNELVTEEGLKLHANVKKLLSPLLEGKFILKQSAYLKKMDCSGIFTGKPVISPAILAAYKNFADNVNQVLSSAAALRQGLKYLPFLKLASLLAEAFQKNREVDGVVPIAMIPHLAAAALRPDNGVSEALCRMGSTLTHFLVDEFQDTSRKQWDVLETLAVEALGRGGSLTWVGDVKQSIYGWRGADPALFSEIGRKAELTAVGGSPTEEILEKNWRSAKTIVDGNNAIFKSLADINYAQAIMTALLPAETPPDIISSAAARLAENFADVQQKSSQTGQHGYVHGETLAAKNSDELNDVILEKLSGLVQEILTRHPAGDVYVLTRSNNQATLAAHTLVNDGIPVMTENSLLLAEHPLVIQSVALLAFLNNPLDEVAFWTLISGSIFMGQPAGRQPDRMELNDWAAMRGAATMFMQFREKWPDCWERLLAPFYNQASLMTAYDTIMEWYAFMDVEKRFPTEKTFLRRFMEVLHRAETRGHASIAAFLEYWEVWGGEEKTPVPEHMDAVRIMTIHKAKGLQAPVVIVPWTDFKIKASAKLVAVETAGLAVPVMLDTKAAGDLHYEELAKQAIEALNMLYVAFTRPEAELYFFHGRTDSGRCKKGLALVMDDLLKEAGLSFPLILGKPASSASAPKQPQTSLSQPIEHAAADSDIPQNSAWLPMQWLPALKIFRNRLDNSTLSAEERGIFLHFCLERLRFEGDSWEDAATALHFGLRHSGINVPDDEKLRAGLLNALAWFAAIPQAREWLEKGSSEQTMLSENGEILRPDLITPQHWGTLVIDYKSGSPHKDNEHQMKKYINCLAGLHRSRGKCAGLIVYLDSQAFQIVTAKGCSPLLPTPDFDSHI